MNIYSMKYTVAVVVAIAAISCGLATAAPASTDDAVNACSLLTDAEVAAVIGDIHPGYGNQLGVSPICLWYNLDRSAAVALSVGPPDSATSEAMSLEALKSRDGVRAGPDGMLIYEVPNSNAVMVIFAAAGRTCSIKADASASLEDRESAEIYLAGKVKDRLQ